MAQVIGYKNQALISLEAQKRKKIQKIEFGMAKMYMETINLKTKRICTSIQTTIVYTTLIQKKRPLVIQRTHRSNTS